MCKHICCSLRGMFTLALSQPLPTAPLAIPPLNLSGRVPPRNASVGLDHVEKPPGMTVWAEFHNGVAAGLKISPSLSQVRGSHNNIHNVYYTCTHNASSSDNKCSILPNQPVFKMTNSFEVSCRSHCSLILHGLCSTAPLRTCPMSMLGF